MSRPHTFPALTAALAAAGALAAAAPAWAHHSFARFNMADHVTIEGDVAEVQWTNPHMWVEVDVLGPDGQVVRWGVEFNSPNNLTRQGWRRDTIKTGDHVVFEISPLRDGQPGGLFYTVRLPSGELIEDPSAAAARVRAEAAAQAGAPD